MTTNAMHAQQNCYSAHLPTPPDAAGDFFTLDDDFRSTSTDFISRPDHQFQQQQQHQLPNHRLNQDPAHLLPQMSSCDQSFPSAGDYHSDYLSFNKTPESDAASIDFTHILTMDCESNLDKHAVNHSQGDSRVQQQQQPDYNSMHSFNSYSNFPNNFTSGGELDSSNGYVVSDGHQGMGNGHNTFYVQNTNGNYAQSFVQSSSSEYSTGHHPVYTMSPSTQQDGNQPHVHIQQHHQSQMQMQQRMQHHQQQQQHAVQYFRSEEQQQFNQQHEMMTMNSNGQGSPASRSASTPSSTASLSFSSSSSSSHEPFYDQQHPVLTPNSGTNNNSASNNNSSGGMSISAIKRETGEQCGTGAAAHHQAVVSCKNKSPLLNRQSSHPLCVQTHHLTSHHNQLHEHHNHHNHNHHHRTTNGTLTGSNGSSASVNNKREKKVGKKRRDPNEPQKPVSAYALFFRDTQATIKGSQPNASFGEVSKIVASMWDSLDPESKANYKKRTEQAKKEYMKALAQYRATLISGSSQQQQQQQQSSPSITLSANNASSMVTGNSPPNHNSNMRTGCPSSNGNAVFLSMQQQHQQQQRQHPSPLQKRSPLLTSALQANATAPTPLIVQHQHHPQQQQQQQHSSLLMQQSPVVDSYTQNS